MQVRFKMAKLATLMRKKNELMEQIAGLITEHTLAIGELTEKKEAVDRLYSNEKRKNSKLIKEKNELVKKYTEACSNVYKLHQQNLTPDCDKEDMLVDILELYEDMKL